MLCCRHSSAVDNPASPCFRIAIICSSLCRVPFIAVLLSLSGLRLVSQQKLRATMAYKPSLPTSSTRSYPLFVSLKNASTQSHLPWQLWFGRTHI